ncbi:MAG: TetR/AcrR family transcriptional regulator [Methyloligellaceae bacterium]
MVHISIHENERTKTNRMLKNNDTAGKNPVANSRTRKKAQTRERILRAANVLFRKQGYEDAKTTELASKVGVSHGTIFAHFDSKASILRELVSLRMRDDLLALKDIRVNGEGAIEKLKDFARTLWQRAQSAPELTAAYHAQSWTWTPAEELEYRQLVEGGLALAKNILHQGVERGEVSSALNIDMVLEILQVQYFDFLRQAQYGRLKRHDEAEDEVKPEEQPVADDSKHIDAPLDDIYLEQFESVIDYLVRAA